MLHKKLRNFANLLSINQGVKSDIYTIHDFTLKLTNGFESAENELFKSSNSSTPLTYRSN